MATCFFLGHRNAPEALRPLLDKAIERHITVYGVTEFVVGHYGRFDDMAAEAVKAAKVRHPQVKLVLLLPYYPFPYDNADYDSSYYPAGMEGVPKAFAIVRANEHMIKTSEYLICCDMGLVGNTRKLVETALRRQKRGELRVENLAKVL